MVTLEEIKEAREKAETKITEAINSLESLGVGVHDIRFQVDCPIGAPSRTIGSEIELVILNRQ